MSFVAVVRVAMLCEHRFVTSGGVNRVIVMKVMSLIEVRSGNFVEMWQQVKVVSSSSRTVVCWI